MQVYLVGGAVRDDLLGLSVTERDWCVVGATAQELLDAGYRQVGKDFPVFLHPESGEEYALARTERKTGSGYHGFEMTADPTITIEDDLLRRDLTINAMARDPDGTLIDPYQGHRDLESRTLRHVSDAFAEDPVRILRAARFAARFAHLGFRVASETMRLMETMVTAGEAAELAPERVWKEVESALRTRDPQVFFSVLRSCGALAVIFPEIDALFGVPQPPKWHPEIDTGAHTLMVLEQAARLSDTMDVRFAALVHDLGKADTPPEKLPSHPGHERRSVERIHALCERLPVPRAMRDLALLVAEFHGHVHKAAELTPKTVLKVLERCDAFRRSERFDRLLLACEADARGRTGLEDRDYPQRAMFAAALDAALKVPVKEIAEQEQDGKRIAEAIRRARLLAIRSIRPE